MAFYENPYFNQNYIPATYADLSAIPVLSGISPLQSEDFTPYLCQLLKISNIPYVDPAVRIENENGFDYFNYLNAFYGQLSAIGDSRVNFYEVWTDISENILPRAITQIEIAQAGGCQVMDGYICNSDGEKIKKASSLCGEGSNFLKPISYEEVVQRVVNFVQNKHDEHADAYAEYIKRNYIDKGWTVKLIFYEKMYIFYAEAQKDTERDYIKFYQESRKRVSDYLNIPITVKNVYFLENDSPENFRKMIQNFVVPSIPDYRPLV